MNITKCTICGAGITATREQYLTDVVLDEEGFVIDYIEKDDSFVDIRCTGHPIPDGHPHCRRVTIQHTLQEITDGEPA